VWQWSAMLCQICFSAGEFTREAQVCSFSRNSYRLAFYVLLLVLGQFSDVIILYLYGMKSEEELKVILLL